MNSEIRGFDRSPWLYASLGAVVALSVVGAVVLWQPALLGLQPSGARGAGGPPGGGPGDGPGGGPGGPGGFAPPVEVVAAIESMATEPVRLLGTVQAIKDSVVASEVDGLVESVSVDEGDSVRAGDLLAQLRTKTLEKELAAARASRAESAARLVSAEADVERLTQLLESGAISERELEQAVAERDALEQSVARFAADAERLEELIEQARIRAPFTGEVTAVHVEEGEWVIRGGRIATLVDLSRVEVTVPLPERHVDDLETGQSVEVGFDALPDSSFIGKIDSIVAQATPEARTFPTIIRIANPARRIRAGMLARVMVQVGEPKPAVLVPKDAIVRDRDRTTVFRLGSRTGEGSTAPAEQVEVRTGTARGEWRTVFGDVGAGDLVVVRGNERLRPGQNVRVAARAEMEPPSSALDGPPGRAAGGSDGESET